MDIYIIPPLSQLNLIEEGDRVFVLAQLWLRSKEYREFIFNQKEKGKWITLDNGVGDRDYVSQDQLLDITQELLPNEVISLDVLFDEESTIYNLNRFIELMKGRDLLNKVEIFAVPQGNNIDTWKRCYTIMLNNPFVKTIGLSKITVPYVYGQGVDDQGIMEGRHECYKDLKQLDLIRKPIHCLGAGDPREFLKYINDPLMRSTDSCFSVWAAINKLSWEEGNFKRIKTPKDYFNRLMSEKEVSLAKSNINFLKKVVNSER